MKNRSIKALKSILIFSCLLLVVNAVQFVLHIIEQSPLWLILLFILPISIVIIPILLISSDLLQMKLVTTTGLLIKKYANTIIVSNENGKLKKYKVFKEDIAEINKLKINQVIEIEHFKCSKALTDIRQLHGE